MSGFVGVDVSKAKLDVAVRPSGEIWEAANTPEGIAGLTERLREVAPERVVLEATGGYELLLVGALLAARLPVVVVNPRQTGKLAQTDVLDARVLAHYGEAVQMPLRELPDDAAQELTALVARRRQLVDMRTMELNRLQIAPRRLHPQVRDHVAGLDRYIQDLDRELHDLIPVQSAGAD